MDAQVKEKWLGALRSGKYEQGKNCLRNGNAFCCLGVLLDVHDPSKWNEPDSIIGSYSYGADENMSFLPRELHDAFGFGSAQESELTVRNDDGEDFKTIADFIEKRM